MAYVPKQVPEEEKNQFANPNETTPNPVPPQGAGSAGTGGQSAPGMGTSTQFGSNAAKLSDYLNANKEQVAEFGNKVAGNLNQGYDQTMGSINQGFGDFNNQVSQGYEHPGQEFINEAVSNPADFIKDQNKASQFQKLYNNQYAGPSSFEGTDFYSNVNKQINKAKEDSSLASSPAGLGTYLNNYMGTANNSPGIQTLDTALLQRSPEASKSIRDAASRYGNLSDYLGQKTGEANASVGQARTSAEQNKNEAVKAIEDAQKAQQTQLETVNNPMLRSELQAYENRGNVQAPEASRYLQSNADDIARANALASLSGQANSPYLNQNRRDFLNNIPDFQDLMAIYQSLQNQ